jgi:tetratricopeptide (TPR) repeat protein
MLAQVLLLACGLARCEPAAAATPSVTPCPRCVESRAMDSMHAVTLRRARSATRDGAWNEAAELWRDALLIDDRSAAHWLTFGDVLLHAERHREAVGAYLRAVQVDARVTERGTRGVARSYALMGDDRQAVRWLEQALRLGARADVLLSDESFRRFRNEPRLRGKVRRNVDRRGGPGSGEQRAST